MSDVSHANLQSQIAEALKRAAPPGELDGLDEAGLAALAAEALGTAGMRAPGTHAISVGAGVGSPGARRMTVVLSTDDTHVPW